MFVGGVGTTEPTVVLVDDPAEISMPIYIPGLPTEVMPAQMADGNAADDEARVGVVRDGTFLAGDALEPDGNWWTTTF